MPKATPETYGVYWVLIVFVLLVQINACFVFNSVRNAPFFTQRHPRTVMLQTVFGAMFIITVAVPLILLKESYSVCAWIFGFFFGIGALFISAYRVYISYYDLGFHRAVVDSKWRLLVNTDDQNWFLARKESFGNVKKVIAYFAVLWGIFFFLGPLYQSIAGINRITRLIQAVAALTPLLHILIVLCKLPRYDDSIMMRREVKSMSILFTLTFVAFFVHDLILNPQLGTMEYLSHEIIMVEAVLSVTYCQVYWVCYVNGFPLAMWHYPFASWWTGFPCCRRALGVADQLTLSVNSPASASALDSKTRSLNLPQILGSEALSLWCRHLSSEFSSENILFLMESQQFMNAVKARADKNDNKSNVGSVNSAQLLQQSSVSVEVDANKLWIKFHSSMPTSEIVNSDETVFKQAIRIFEKYVTNSAPYCVNLSDNCRRKMYSKFHYEDYRRFQRKYVRYGSGGEISYESDGSLILAEIWDESHILWAFEDARNEVYRLLKSSLPRFLISDGFRRWSTQRCSDIADKA